jgi:aarF domain-containing kinase
MFGSPVNRIKTMGTWASRALTTTGGLKPTDRLSEYWADARFRTVLFTLDLLFWATRLRGWIQARLGLEREGLEDEIEKRMRGMAKDSLGYEIGPTAFEG